MSPTNAALRPMILIRGFGGTDISGVQGSPYQGYNDGTVYPGKRGENYIYEGFLLRALKSDGYPYSDATNVVGYYAEDVALPDDLDGWEAGDVSGTIVIDPATARRVLERGPAGTIWVYRYYDLAPRTLERYGKGLRSVRDFARKEWPLRGSPADVRCHAVLRSAGG